MEQINCAAKTERTSQDDIYLHFQRYYITTGSDILRWRFWKLLQIFLFFVGLFLLIIICKFSPTIIDYDETMTLRALFPLSNLQV